MDINSEGIYNSKALAPYKVNNIAMTQQDNGSAYFFYMAKEDEKKMPSKITVNAHQPVMGSNVTLLGYDKPLSWTTTGEGFTVNIPKKLQNNPPSNYVWTIKISEIQKK
jgi:alpha-L-fucosidase